MISHELKVRTIRFIEFSNEIATESYTIDYLKRVTNRVA